MSNRITDPLSLWLISLTFTAGTLDAVSFSALGRVFTSLMTGNVAILGFALAGVEGLSASRSTLALGAFSIGAACGGSIAGVAGDIITAKDRSFERILRRVVSVMALLAGAAAGGLLIRLAGIAAPLGVASGIAAIATTAYRRSKHALRTRAAEQKR